MPLPIDDYNALVDSVTLASVKEAAKQYLVTDNRLYATLKPQPSGSEFGELYNAEFDDANASDAKVKTHAGK